MPPRLSLLECSQSIAARLYEGIAAPDQWQAGLGLLAAKVGGQAFHQVTVDLRDGSVPDRVICDAAPLHKFDEYAEHYVQGDERLALFAHLREGSFILDHEHLDSRQMSRSAVYADFLRSVDLRHTLCILQRDDGQTRDYLGIMRPADHRPYGDRERALLELVMPDMVRAARLRARMRQLQREALVGRAALDGLPRGVAVVDARGRIEYANARAERYLRTSPWLAPKGGILGMRDAATQRRLQAALSQACSTARKADLFSTGGPLPVWITVLPLDTLHLLAGLRDTPLALVIFSVPTDRLPLDTQLIVRALGITPAEARLALALATGQTIKEYAAAQAVSPETARSHLKNLFRKTGCRRQVELVQLIRTLA
ncbi:LuxR C-terminal-related transcriptional regulator [Pigmentiphaga sp. YJ18]|uniref:helix-turn-helix transcriptional regulator n=1 Tax=Pigmentiphaga sp. YJ18 TaxID=3134907 RepID=UPI003117F0F3